MGFQFYKYSATGNDFVILDNREGNIALDKSAWANLCDRKLGIGADGVLFVEKHERLDFSMRYLNADGGEVSMCGNGARAISHFVHHILKLKNSGHYSFMTGAGMHESWVINDQVRVRFPKIKDIEAISVGDLYPAQKAFYANSGVPHVVFEVLSVDAINVDQIGRKIRYESRFLQGTNVNFYEILSPNKIKLRTYERGVEAETLACGTGAVASALCYQRSQQSSLGVDVLTRGGLLKIEFAPDLSWTFLEGEVTFHHKGFI